MALTPALQPIDGVAVSYIDAAVALGNTINEMDKYYTQENYKDDAFAKGKTFHYYSLAVMISAKQINNLISQDKLDAEAAMKKVSELETLVAQAKEADKSGMNFSFINSAGQYQLELKNTFAASEIKSRTLTGIKSNFRTQTQAGWPKTHFHERYAITTKWSMKYFS